MMGGFERWLSLWVALAMAVGIVIGQIAPALVEAVAAAEIARINLVVAMLIWAILFLLIGGHVTMALIHDYVWKEPMIARMTRGNGRA